MLLDETISAGAVVEFDIIRARFFKVFANEDRAVTMQIPGQGEQRTFPEGSVGESPEPFGRVALRNTAAVSKNVLILFSETPVS